MKKLIHYSNHARLQMLLRGATEEEVEKAIRSGQRQPAKLGKFKVQYCFDYNSISPVNNKFYKYKTVEPIFAEELKEVIIVTVKVFYSNKEISG